MTATVLEFPKEQAQVPPATGAEPAERAHIQYDLYQPEKNGYVGIDLIIPGSKLIPFLEFLGLFLHGQ